MAEDEKKAVELDDEALEEVAGGTWVNQTDDSSALESEAISVAGTRARIPTPVKVKCY